MHIKKATDTAEAIQEMCYLFVEAHEANENVHVGGGGNADYYAALDKRIEELRNIIIKNLTTKHGKYRK